MAESLGLKRSDATVVRHPLSSLTEAADDICYRMLDLEDAVDMGILDDSEVRDVFLAFLDDANADDDLAKLRGEVISSLIDACSKIFERNYDSILAGHRFEDLKSDLPATTHQCLNQVRELYDTIFAHRVKMATEIGAYKCLGRIIDVLLHAVEALHDKQDYSRIDFLTRRRLELAWGSQYVQQNQSQSMAWWQHQVMDYVAGLTDNYAHQLSREIAGCSHRHYCLILRLPAKYVSGVKASLWINPGRRYITP
jgi:dGTPase